MMIFLTMIIKWLAVHDLTDIKVKAGTVQYSTVQYSFTVHWNVLILQNKSKQ